VKDLKGKPDMRAAKDDWENDSTGKLEMTYPMFYNAIFELVDVWCETTVAQDYVDFLDSLLHVVALTPPWPPTQLRHRSDVGFVEIKPGGQASCKVARQV
jgi:hypothetical protein